MDAKREFTPLECPYACGKSVLVHPDDAPGIHRMGCCGGMVLLKAASGTDQKPELERANDAPVH